MIANILIAMPAALFVLAVIAIWAIAGVFSMRRAKALARKFPDAEVIHGLRNRALDFATSAYVSRGEWIDGPGAFPFSFTIVISATGVSFWKTRNAQIVAVPWADLGPVTFILIPQSPRKFRGINFQIKSEGSAIEIPAIVMGRGPFGQFVQTRDAIEIACQRAEAWRLASSPRA